MGNSAIDKTARRAQARAKTLGAIARGRKRSITENPHPTGTLERQSWDAGWRIEDSRREANAAS